MKKLLISVSITLSVLIITSCKQKDSKVHDVKGNTSQHTLDTIKERRITLNGFSYDEANKMILDFPGSVNNNLGTTIWFSKQYIDSLAELLTVEKSKVGADGIRIYFATNSKGQNTVVIVSTLDDGPDPKRADKKIHLDYFKHDESFLSSPFATNKDENTNDEKGAGLLFKNTQCPSETCNIFTEHHITCDDAKKWVMNWADDDINTKSEWFDSSLISYLRDELDSQGAIDHFADGIRIYYAKRVNDDKNLFVLVTTKTDGNLHRDYYECYNGKKFLGPTDNGEQCPDNCTGSTLPKP